MNGSWIPSHLQLTVVQGRELALKSRNVNSEVYVQVQVDKEKVTTLPLPRDTHPHWRQTFEIPLMSLQSYLEIQVRQKSTFTDDFIGQIRLPITSLSISTSICRNWFKLAARPGKTSTKIRGDILIATCFLSNWDLRESQFSSPIDSEIQSREKRMLRRTKSEYKSRAKDSPKNDRSKQKSVFDRLRRNKSNAFEECEDFDILPVRTPQSPPTPLSSERKKMSDSLSSSPTSVDGDLSSLMFPTNGSDYREMFSEAAQLERTGVLDLSRVDPITRVEHGRQMFESHRQGNECVEHSDYKSSPVLSSYSYRHKRPLRTQSLSIKPRSPNDSALEDKQQSYMTTSTPTGTPSSRFSPAVTYRATSMKKRGKRNLSQDGASPQGSSTSIDEQSITSEYYSSTSLSENPSKSLSVVSVEEERKQEDTCKNEQKSNVKSQNDLCKKDSVPETSNGSPVTISFDHSQDDQLHPESSRKLTDRHDDRQFLEAPVPRDACRREKSLPTDTQTLEREEIPLRKSRKRYASETSDKKRHSADIESLLRLTALAQGKNDGLGNVLNTEHIKMKLQQQSSCNLDKSHSFTMSQPSSQSCVTRSANSTPPCLQHDQLHISSSHEVIHMSNPEGTNEGEIELSDSLDPAVSPLESMSFQNESLPSLKRMYYTENGQIPVTPSRTETGICLDKASLFESGGSSSISSMLHTPSSASTSLDSSFSSDYTSLSNNRRIDNVSASGSECATPSSITPTVSRGGTPSPELQLPQLESEGEVANKNNPKDGEKRAARHTYKRPSFGSSKGNMPPLPPLPPSLKYATLPSRGKFADASNMTSLVNEAIRVLAPYETKDSSPANVRTKNLPIYSMSASNSGRTSPVIIEEKEEDEEEEKGKEGKGTTTTVSSSNGPVAVSKGSLPNDGSRQVQTTCKPADDSSHTPTKRAQKPPAVSSQTYESNSLQRRRRGGGLQKTLSLYQDNKRQTASARRALFKTISIDNPPTTTALRNVQMKQYVHPGIKGRPSTKPKEDHPKEKSSITKEKTKLRTTPTSSSNDPSPTSKDTSDDQELNHPPPQSNGFIKNHATSTGNEFNLPPPPDISHTLVAEKVCGLRKTEERRDEDKSDVSDKDESWKDSQSSLASSSDGCEELCHEDLEIMSKNALIDLVVQKNLKLTKTKKKLADTQLYLDSLLLKVMEKHPELLASQ